MKTLICALPGLIDVQLQDLGGLTPLKKASTENLDQITRESRVLSVSSPEDPEMGMLSFLSGKPIKKNLSKASFQARSINLDSSSQIFSARLSSAEDGVIVDVSDDLVSDKEGCALCDALNKLPYQFIHLKGPHILLAEEGNNHDKFKINPIETLGKHWKDFIADSSLAKITRRASKILEKSEVNSIKAEFEDPPANSLLITDGGGEVETYSSELNLKNTLLFTTCPLSIGIAKSLGIDTLDLEDKNKYDYIQNILDKLDAVFASKDCFIVELPYIWQSTYKGNLLEKIKRIEWIDKFFIANAIKYCKSKGFQLVIMPMCNSDIRTGTLTGGDFPAIIYPGEGSGKISIHELLQKILTD